MRIDPLDPGQFPMVMRQIGVAADPAWARGGQPEWRALYVKHRRRFLTATPPARSRLRAWLDAGVKALPPLPLFEREASVRRRLTLFGDLVFVPIVVRGLLLLPECVRQHVLAHVVFVCVGKTSQAWTSSSRLDDVDGQKPRMIVLGPDVDEALVVHECFHTWHAPLTSVAAISALGELGFYQQASREGWRDRIDDEERRQENIAHGAAIAWTWR